MASWKTFCSGVSFSGGIAGYLGPDIAVSLLTGLSELLKKGVAGLMWALQTISRPGIERESVNKRESVLLISVGRSRMARTSASGR